MANVNEALIMDAKAAVISAACGLCAESEEMLLQRLEGLYWAGFKAGSDTMKSVLKDVSGELSQIVVAHIQGDADQLKATLDDFARRHVLVTGHDAERSH